MRVVFRTDASLEIGNGHVMRCLTLADALAAHGADCSFVCRELPGNLIQIVQGQGFPVAVLPLNSTDEDDLQTVRVIPDHIDWLVVDHYQLDAKWEMSFKAIAKRILVIDDLANRPHVADVLLDQNLGRKQADYLGLVPHSCTFYIGPRHALLRQQFSEIRPESLARRAEARVGRLLISMGGADAANTTGAIVEALKSCGVPEGCSATVVMGPFAPWRREVEQQINSLRWPVTMLVDVRDMARVLAESDLAIGAMGTSAWERCCMGLPTIGVTTAENQRGGAVALQAAGCVVLLADGDDSFSDLPDKLRQMVDPVRLAAMQLACASLTDGLGAQRLAQEMICVE
jgi:UDP-2,4-diacetamido-2,4,6-trideoxy-beta-L-altropyranose hydrolase